MVALSVLEIGREEAHRARRNVRALGLGPDAEFFVVYTLACLVASARMGMKPPTTALVPVVGAVLAEWDFDVYAAYHLTSPEAAVDKAMRGRARCEGASLL